MMLESVKHDPLIWPTVEENGVTKTKKYDELSATEKIQADCDMKATNIILQGLPSDIYSLINHHRVAKDLWERIQLLMQGDDPIACLNKEMAFLTDVASLMYKSNVTTSGGNNSSGQARVVECYNCQDLGVPDGQVVQIIIPSNAAFQTKDLGTYDSDCDDISNAKPVFMANISNYGSDVISEANVQDTHLEAQQDSMILFVIEQMLEQMINHVNN
nr:hypothetical protein [Tanacetum cinerariifolium]